jgi:hypothetical protein
LDIHIVLVVISYIICCLTELLGRRNINNGKHKTLKISLIINL